MEKIIPQFINVFKLMLKQNKETSEMWFRSFRKRIDLMDGTRDIPSDMPYNLDYTVLDVTIVKMPF